MVVGMFLDETVMRARNGRSSYRERVPFSLISKQNLIFLEHSKNQKKFWGCKQIGMSEMSNTMSLSNGNLAGRRAGPPSGRPGPARYGPGLGRENPGPGRAWARQPGPITKPGRARAGRVAQRRPGPARLPPSGSWAASTPSPRLAPVTVPLSSRLPLALSISLSAPSRLHLPLCSLPSENQAEMVLSSCGMDRQNDKGLL
ncbi:hypothetical protein EJ110_NYTH26002 [Nymphaea thermarum]|nr:hypothetical protein EJ110_NYTH26002 [Nymphaea thermarum]